jgi:hypothetical protein
MRYRDLPAVQFVPPPSGRIALPEGAKISDLFISPSGQHHWTHSEERRSTIVAEDGQKIDLRPPGADGFFCPKIQRFLDGRWLAIDPRTDADTPNAFVFDPDGKLIQSFYAGDGIETAVVDRSNRIWVGYFDEGVFGAAAFAYRGIPRDNACYRYGPNGLVRLSDRGEIEFAYNTRFGDKPGRFIDWICALTVTEDQAWFHAGSKGFVGSVLNDQVEYVLPDTPSIGVRALCVGANHISFFGRYKMSSMVAVVERNTQRMRLLQLRRDDATTLSPQRVATRGAQALAIADDQLYRLDQDVLLEALGPWTDDNSSTLGSAIQYQTEESSYADSWIIYGVGSADRRIPGEPRPREIHRVKMKTHNAD